MTRAWELAWVAGVVTFVGFSTLFLLLACWRFELPDATAQIDRNPVNANRV
jgi:hypothetical protein